MITKKLNNVLLIISLLGKTSTDYFIVLEKFSIEIYYTNFLNVPLKINVFVTATLKL